MIKSNKSTAYDRGQCCGGQSLVPALVVVSAAMSVLIVLDQLGLAPERNPTTAGAHTTPEWWAKIPEFPMAAVLGFVVLVLLVAVSRTLDNRPDGDINPLLLIVNMMASIAVLFILAVKFVQYVVFDGFSAGHLMYTETQLEWIIGLSLGPALMPLILAGMVLIVTLSDSTISEARDDLNIGWRHQIEAIGFSYAHFYARPFLMIRQWKLADLVYALAGHRCRRDGDQIIVDNDPNRGYT